MIPIDNQIINFSERKKHLLRFKIKPLQACYTVAVKDHQEIILAYDWMLGCSAAWLLDELEDLYGYLESENYTKS